MTDHGRPAGALPLAGGWCWFDRAERLERGRRPEVVPLTEVPGDWLDRLTAPRPDWAGLAMDRPRIMSILNVTPDSFSDGGRHAAPAAALAEARAMATAGADLIDIGGESTRPGAAEVPVAAEIARTQPVIAALAAEIRLPLSIDTRKAAVAAAALEAGATVINDVAALTFDRGMAALAAGRGAPVVLMHAQGRPETMQQDPTYDDVVLDVFDFLEDRIAAAEAAGILRSAIAVDPGIGFGKTLQHNVTLLRHLSLYHGLGCPILLGASRKRFIGTLSRAEEPQSRGPGSVTVAMHGVSQGVQILRVHDTAETRQALGLQEALIGTLTG